ncbi:MAG: hypothetical protein A2X94_11605 [Bdellovibrionales bacterium GWB1_55_8]|nr:MAG: hypothetical protein A2X94_11605 [Bdellovibrionales bacterium GWB1_55_8]
MDLPARVSSVVEAVPAQEGQRVKKGDLLLSLSGEDLKLTAETAVKDHERAEKLYRAGSMPREAYDHLRLKRDDILLKLKWTSIQAPVDATVLDIYREPGEWVAPGTKLLTLADLSEVWAMVYIAQPLLAKLNPGQEIEAILPELPGRTFRGRIARIREEAEFTPKNVQTTKERARLVFGVKIVFPNPDGVLKPGMTVEVRLPEES